MLQSNEMIIKLHEFCLLIILLFLQCNMDTSYFCSEFVPLGIFWCVAGNKSSSPSAASELQSEMRCNSAKLFRHPNVVAEKGYGMALSTNTPCCRTMFNGLSVIILALRDSTTVVEVLTKPLALTLLMHISRHACLQASTLVVSTEKRCQASLYLCRR
ncbi:uncharacterized protein [Populus alba]|uniref:uncharacterized protein n=1 Tax=Populus alba TaxID=43335 RepID=UPI003CC72844